MVYFANLCVSLRDRLCDVAGHVSAQSLDFLDLDEISSFLNWKHQYVSMLKESHRGWTLASFHPGMVYSANLGVNLRDRLCDVAGHVSAQLLDFLDLDEISSFLNWKREYVPIRKEGRCGWTLTILLAFVVLYQVQSVVGNKPSHRA